MIGQLVVVLLFGRPLWVDSGTDSTFYWEAAESFPSLEGPQWGYVGYAALLRLDNFLGSGGSLVVIFQLGFFVYALNEASRLLERLSNSLTVLVAQGLVALNPLINQWHKYVLTDSIAISVALFAISRLLRWKIYGAVSLAPLGACLFLLTLLRPNGLMLSLPLMTAWLVWENVSRPKKAVILLTTCLLALVFLIRGPFVSHFSDPNRPSLMGNILTGEAVLGTNYLSVSMPQASTADRTLIALGRYWLEHPYENGGLFLRKVFAEVTQVRPWYSLELNIGAAVAVSGIVLGSLYSVFLLIKKPQLISREAVMLPVAIACAYLVWIGITWAIWEGRFGWVALVGLHIPSVLAGRVFVSSLRGRLT
jgi:hypothetical protein